MPNTTPQKLEKNLIPLPPQKKLEKNLILLPPPQIVASSDFIAPVITPDICFTLKIPFIFFVNF